jgi:ribonuclease HI
MNQLSFLKPIASSAQWYLFADGAARGNPGTAGIGIYICKDQEPVEQRGYYAGTKTNNQAEYLALLLGLIIIQKIMPVTDILHIRLDSELLVHQISGRYAVKNQELKKLYTIVKLILPVNYTMSHIPRAENAQADRLANLGIDKKIKIPKEILETPILHDLNI